MFGSVIDQFETEYNVTVNESTWGGLSGNESKFDLIDTEARSLKGTIESSEEDTGWKVFRDALALPTMIVKVPKLIFASFEFMLDLIGAVFVTMGLPEDLEGLAKSAFLVIVLFAIVSWFAKRRV